MIIVEVYHICIEIAIGNVSTSEFGGRGADKDISGLDSILVAGKPLVQRGATSAIRAHPQSYTDGRGGAKNGC